MAEVAGMAASQNATAAHDKATGKAGAGKSAGTDTERRSTRKPVRVAGMITAPSKRISMGCAVHDISATGARLKLYLLDKGHFTKSARVPRTFTLQIPADRIEADCEVVWEKEEQVGVRFLSPVRTMAAKRKP
jgi:hypothetical protein